jgi:hypothetical protein
MLVGHNTVNSDSNKTFRRMSKYNNIRGMGQELDNESDPIYGTSTSTDNTSTILAQMSASQIGTAESNSSNPYGVNASTGGASTSGSSANAISNFFSNLVNDATKAFSSTQTQCSIGTTLVGNQCLPTSTVNALALSANPSAAIMSSLSGFLPLIMGGVALVFIMNMSKGR